VNESDIHHGDTESTEVHGEVTIARAEERALFGFISILLRVTPWTPCLRGELLRRCPAPFAFLLLAAVALADDATRPAAVEFGKDLVAAQTKAKADAKPLLVLVVPKWFASPEVSRLDRDVLATDDAKRSLDSFVRVRVEESEDREVHARHRVQFRGYPLAVVLAADGSFLGSTSGLPAEDTAKAWLLRVASIAPGPRR